MDFRHLEYLVALAEEGSFTSAARRLHVSQPSLSQLVKRVERDLHFQLFDRSSTPVGTTPAGALFVERARGLLADYRRARDDASALATPRTGQVRLGATFLVATRLFPPLLDRMVRDGRAGWLDLVEGTGRELAELVEGGLVDCAVMNAPDHREKLTFEPLVAAELVVVFPSSSPWSARGADDQVGIDELAALPLLLQKAGGVRSVVDAYFRGSGRAPHVVFESRGTDTLLALVKLGTGVAIVPRVLVPPADIAETDDDQGKLTVAELRAPVPQTHVGVIRRRGAPADPDLDTAIALVRAELSSWPHRSST